jgi:hypothetical protein
MSAILALFSPCTRQNAHCFTPVYTISVQQVASPATLLVFEPSSAQFIRARCRCPNKLLLDAHYRRLAPLSRPATANPPVGPSSRTSVSFCFPDERRNAIGRHLLELHRLRERRGVVPPGLPVPEALRRPLGPGELRLHQGAPGLHRRQLRPQQLRRVRHGSQLDVVLLRPGAPGAQLRRHRRSQGAAAEGQEDVQRRRGLRCRLVEPPDLPVQKVR